MLALFKDPSGEMIFNTQAGSSGSSVSANSTLTLTQRSSQQGEHNSYVTGLEARIRELELKLEQALKV